MSSKIQFATSRDGTKIAYSARGQGDLLVFSRGWVQHLDQVDDDPSIRAFFARIEPHYRVVRYDGRGNGLSDRELSADLSLQDLVDDLEAVVDALGADKVILWGSSWAGPTAVQFAATHPEHVTSLILEGTFADGSRLTTPERAASFLAMLATARYQPEAVFASLSFMTDPEPGLTHQRKVERAREAISPDSLLKLHELLYQMDVTQHLERVDCPTLVMHRRGSRSVPVASARDLAAGIPGSVLAEFEGRAHNPWEEDPHTVLQVLGDFLGNPELAVPNEPRHDARLVSLVYVDQVSSTKQMVRLGDRRGVEVQAQMIELMQHAAEPFGAEALSDTGDGVVLALQTPSEAVAVAQVIQRRVEMHNQDAKEEERFRIRVGAHTGEIMKSNSGRVSGLSMAYASRLCDLADADQIVVSEVTKTQAESAIGSADFTRLPAASLKGLGEVTPYLVAW